MASSHACTVEEYLQELPEERRTVLSSVRTLILSRLPTGYVETMLYGMISYIVPLSVYSQTYNQQPLAYLSLAAQKNHYALYLTCVYQDAECERQLGEGYAKSGKKLDLGKSCLRFKKLSDLPLEVIGDCVASTPLEAFLRSYEKSRTRT